MTEEVEELIRVIKYARKELVFQMRARFGLADQIIQRNAAILTIDEALARYNQAPDKEGQPK